MFLIICLIIALAVGAAVASIFFWEHRHLCRESPNHNTQESSGDAINRDPPPPYAPIMDESYLLPDDWIEGLGEALELASAPHNPSSMPTPLGPRVNQTIREQEDQDPLAESQPPQQPHRFQGNDARAIRDPRLMRQNTRKALGELIFFTYECPTLMATFKNLVASSFGYLAHICHSLPVRSILDAAQIQAARQRTPHRPSVLGLPQEVSLFHMYYTRAAQAIENDRGECWTTPEEAHRDADYVRTRDALMCHLDFLWQSTQRWLTALEDPNTASQQVTYPSILHTVSEEGF